MRPALVQAAFEGDFETVRKLVHAGCNINIHDYDCHTALRKAVEKENVEMLEFLVMSGADINLPSSLIGTPLMIAATKKEHRLTDILLKNHAHINSQCYSGKTALHYAADYLNLNSFEALLKAKADTTIRDCHQKLAIDVSSLQFKARMQDLLLNNTELEFEIEKPKSYKDSKPNIT